LIGDRRIECVLCLAVVDGGGALLERLGGAHGDAKQENPKHYRKTGSERTSDHNHPVLDTMLARVPRVGQKQRANSMLL
jgi:hypothetical protein